MHDFAIGDLYVIADWQTNFIVQQPIKGLDAPDYRMSTYDKPGEDFSVLSNLLYGSRVVTLQGIVRGDSADDYETARQQLQAACAIQRDSDGNPTPTQLEFTTLGGTTYKVYGYPGRPLMDYEYATQCGFQVSFTCVDGAIYGDTVMQS